MSKPDNKTVNQPDDNRDRPVTPLDMVIARFGQWVADLEQSKAEHERYTSIPDDVPCFVTRKP